MQVRLVIRWLHSGNVPASPAPSLDSQDASLRLVSWATVSACVDPCSLLVLPARRRSFSRAPGPSRQVGSRQFDGAQATRRTTTADGGSTFGGCERGTKLGRCSPQWALPATRDRRGRPRLPDRGIAPTRDIGASHRPPARAMTARLVANSKPRHGSRRWNIRGPRPGNGEQRSTRRPPSRSNSGT